MVNIGDVVYTTFNGKKVCGQVLRKSKYGFYTIELSNRDIVFRFEKDIDKNEKSAMLSSWAAAFRAAKSAGNSNI